MQLEEHKAYAKNAIQCLQQQLSESVPKHIHDILLQKTEDYKRLCEGLVLCESAVEESMQYSSMQHELEKVKGELENAKQQVAVLEASKKMIVDRTQEKDNDGHDVDDLTALAKCKGLLAEKEVLYESLEKQYKAIQQKAEQNEVKHAQDKEKVSL